VIDRKAFRRDFSRMGVALARRGAKLLAEDSPWQRARLLDEQQRTLKTELEALQAERNRVSKAIGIAKSRGENAADAMARMVDVASRVKTLDAEAKAAADNFSSLLLEIPNLPHPSTPDGTDESDNIERHRWGTPRPDAVPPHWDIGESLGILDFEAGVRLAGSRFSVLRGAGARLERVLMQFMLDLHADQHGYEEVWVPAIANSKALTGTGQLPKFADDLYRLEGEDAFLIPTAEVPITNLYQGQILASDALPIRHCGYTPCFRREAGSAGRDTRGMIRQHQFDKVELVWLLPPDAAEDGLAQLLSHAEAVLQALQLPYRAVDLCAGDIGFSAEKTIDLEVWLPSQQCYREISSCSSFGQFQGRRAGIRYRDTTGKPQPVATLNGSGLAIGRTLVALLENGWQTDGRVQLPDVLQPYMGREYL